MMTAQKTYWSLLLLIFVQYKAGQANCADDRVSCHFCAANANEPRYFRYTDQYLKRVPICMSKPEYCTYDCEQIYHSGSGSVIDPRLCICTYPDPAYTPPNTRGCKLFDVNPDDALGGYIGKIYVETPAGLDIRGDQICSNGTQHINVPYFASNDLGTTINLKLRFRVGKPFSEMADNEEMILWTDGHCDGVTDPRPGFEVSFNRTGVIVRATGPDNVVKSLYCQPYVSGDDRAQGLGNFLPPPIMNKVMVSYRAGKFNSAGTRLSSYMVATVNDGVFKSALSATCFALGLAPSELKASPCPVRIPGKSFNGCLSKVSLQRDCVVESKDEDMLFQS